MVYLADVQMARSFTEWHQPLNAGLVGVQDTCACRAFVVVVQRPAVHVCACCVGVHTCSTQIQACSAPLLVSCVTIQELRMCVDVQPGKKVYTIDSSRHQPYTVTSTLCSQAAAAAQHAVNRLAPPSPQDQPVAVSALQHRCL